MRERLQYHQNSSEASIITRHTDTLIQCYVNWTSSMERPLNGGPSSATVECCPELGDDSMNSALVDLAQSSASKNISSSASPSLSNFPVESLLTLVSLVIILGSGDPPALSPIHQYND